LSVVTSVKYSSRHKRGQHDIDLRKRSTSPPQVLVDFTDILGSRPRQRPKKDLIQQYIESAAIHVRLGDLQTTTFNLAYYRETSSYSNPLSLLDVDSLKHHRSAAHRVAKLVRI
jgi:hypothetical protein